MKFLVTKELTQAGVNPQTSPGETTTIDLPFTKVAAYIGGMTAVISAVITLFGKGGDLISALNKPTPPPVVKATPQPIVLTPDNLKMYQLVLSIKDNEKRQKTLLFFVKNHLIPGNTEELEKLKKEDIQRWPSAVDIAD